MAMESCISSNTCGNIFSGAGFSSKNKYMFGKVTVQIKLVEGDSAGTVTAFYVSSSIFIIIFFNREGLVQLMKSSTSNFPVGCLFFTKTVS